MLSLKAKIAIETIKNINVKGTMDFINPPRFRKRKCPKFLLSGTDYVEGDVEGFRYFTFKGHSKRHVYFLHGGGYSLEATIGHYMLVKKMLDVYGCNVTIIEYPLTPEHQVESALKVVKTLYDQLVRDYPSHEFTFFGDSAGGGMALALAMLIRDLNEKKPETIILVSPWLDIALDNPEVNPYVEKDILLNLENVRAVGTIYRGELDVFDYRVSPIKGDLSKLGRIGVYYTSEEILKPDCEKLLSFQAEGTQVKGFEFEGLWHDFVLWPIPERDYFIELMSAYMYTV